MNGFSTFSVLWTAAFVLGVAATPALVAVVCA